MLLMTIVYFLSVQVYTSYSKIPGRPAGLYEINITSAMKCKNESNPLYNYDLIWNKNDDGADEVSVLTYAPRNMGPIGGRIHGWRLTKKEYVLFFKLETKRICDYLSVETNKIIRPKPDSRCYLPKGPVSFNITDPNKLVHLFVGKYLLYGKYKARFRLTSGKEFLGCADFTGEIIPIRKI